MPAPNPLETLSIPVLDRPTMLAVDEGRNREGSRVTGAYVYAARPGGPEISVVSVISKRALSGKPFSAPAPVTAIGAFMNVDQTADVQATPLPATTRLFVATWDGATAAVYSASIATDSPQLERLPFERQLVIGEQTPITAMAVVPPLTGRTLNGAPFCNITPCLALATRAASGTAGKAFLIDPASGRLANLGFSGPVRELVNSANLKSIYGVLDEQACGGPACGGIVAVDVVAAVSGPSGVTFPASLDATGVPMRPMRSDGLITGLTIGTFHRNIDGVENSGSILQRAAGSNEDGGTVDSLGGFVLQEYQELGAYASSSGVITFFSGLAKSVIDADPRRSTVATAAVGVPGTLSDGGTAFIGEDGGVIATSTSATVSQRVPDPSDTWRIADVTTNDNTVWTVDISDGYLVTQNVALIYQGQIPGLVSLPTRDADGVRLPTGGFESRAVVGDVVRFESGEDLLGFSECGRSRIATIGAGFIEVMDVPPNCENRVRFSVRADGAKPIVAAADVEGYLGRWAPGDTLTYNRPYVLLTAGVIASRTALTINIPAMLPTSEGAFISFQIFGGIVPYQVTLDTLALQSSGGQGCFIGLSGQVVLGNMVMDRVPSSITNSSAIDFRWTVMGVVPSGASLLEFPLSTIQVGPIGTVNSAICRR